MLTFVLRDKRRSLLSAIFLLLTTVCMGKPQAPEGFGAKPAFDEEFNGTSLNKSLWSYRGLGVRDACTVDPSAVSLADGHVRIRIYTANNSHGVPTNYCGAITTSSSFLQKYGYWEAAVRFKYQPGIQTSFWIQSPTIGKIIGNPQQSGVEMDVFEHTSGKTGANEFDHALHWDGYKIGIHKIVAHDGTVEGLDDGNFHVWGLAWTPGTLTFYIDGQKSWQLAASDAAISAIAEYIILDTELPHTKNIPPQGYGPLGSLTNAYLDVDYVHVYPYLKK